MADDASKLDAPMKQKYMRQVRDVLHFISCWPYKTLGQNVSSFPLRYPWPTIGLWYLTLFSCILVLKMNYGLSIIEVGECYITIFLNMINLYRNFVARQKKIPLLTKDFLSVVHLTHYQKKSEIFKKMNERVDVICQRFMNLFYFEVFVCALFYVAPPFVQNYRAGMYSTSRPANGTFVLTFNIVVPYFDPYTHLPTYIIGSILQVYLCMDCAILFAIWEIYLAIILFHVWGHLKVLLYNLNTFPRPANEQFSAKLLANYRERATFKYSPKEEEIVRNMLVENVKHYQMIVWFTANLEKAFGSCFAMYYLFQQISLCISMLACSKLDPGSLLRYGSLTMGLATQLLLISLIVEIIRSKSELLAESVYNTPWECMGTKNRRIVELFLLYVQNKTFKIKGLGMVPVGADTMFAILKSSISYFMLLRTFAVETGRI